MSLQRQPITVPGLFVLGLAIALAVALGPTAALAAPQVATTTMAISLSPETGSDYVDQGDTCRVFNAYVTDEGRSGVAVAGAPVAFSLYSNNHAYVKGNAHGNVYVAKTNANGVANVTVCAAKAGQAEVTAWVDSDDDGARANTAEPTDTATEMWIDSFLSVSKTPSTPTARSGDEITYGYVVAHELESGILYDVELWDDNGTPADGSDDVQITLKGLCDADMDGIDDDLPAGVTAVGSIAVVVTTDQAGTATISGYDAPECLESAGQCSRVLLTATDDAVVEITE